jgi:hypothetical protein
LKIKEHLNVELRFKFTIFTVLLLDSRTIVHTPNNKNLTQYSVYDELLARNTSRSISSKLQECYYARLYTVIKLTNSLHSCLM